MSVSFGAPAFLAGAGVGAVAATILFAPTLFAPTAGADSADLSDTARDVASERPGAGSAADRVPGPGSRQQPVLAGLLTGPADRLAQ